MTVIAVMVLRQKKCQELCTVDFWYLLEVKIHLGNTHLSRLCIASVFFSKLLTSTPSFFSGESPPKPGDAVITLLYVSKYSITAEQELNLK